MEKRVHCCAVPFQSDVAVCCGWRGHANCLDKLLRRFDLSVQRVDVTFGAAYDDNDLNTRRCVGESGSSSRFIVELEA